MGRWFDSAKVARDAITAVLDVERYVRACGLGSELLELVRLRAAQIHGCAHRVDGQPQDACRRSEPEQRLQALAAWRDAPFFTDRERAALAWTEAVTQGTEHHISGDIYRQVRAHFGEKELVDLTMAVIAINAWNWLVIGTGLMPGA